MSAEPRGRNLHGLGVGGWVVRSDGAVLLVRMSYGPADGRLMIPGGHADEGEFIEDTAVREVFEETGIAAVPRGILMVRQRMMDGERNLYLVFWMTHFCIAQATIPQFTWPNCDHSTRVCVPLQQIEWIELKRAVEQQLNIVDEQQVTVSVFIGQLPQDAGRLKRPLFLRNRGQPTSQHRTDIQRHGAATLSQLT